MNMFKYLLLSFFIFLSMNVGAAQAPIEDKESISDPFGYFNITGVPVPLIWCTTIEMADEWPHTGSPIADE